MTAEPTIAERLAPVVQALRSPLARNLDGASSPLGQISVDDLQAILFELPQIQARTPADALALASIAADMVQILAANADGNAMACEAIGTLTLALVRLRTCLAEMAGRSPSEFRLLPVAEAHGGASH